MNLTSQYISNPKSRDTYITSLATYKSTHPSSAKLRLRDDRQVLNDEKKCEILRLEGLTFKMIICPRGIFTMGVSKHNYIPKRVVSINKPFLLGETEVTQELFKKVMGFNPSGFQGYEYPNSNKKPVEKVSWYDAIMFCNKLSERCKKKPYYNISNVVYKKDNVSKKELPNIEKANVTINSQANGFRLPLEKEWEYAAKAGTDNQYSGTNDPKKVGEVAWFDDNSKSNGETQTHHIKGKRPNEWGFYDMTGNVHEWCWDKFEYDSDTRAYRSGGYNSNPLFLQSDTQGYNPPNFRGSNTGFRISASLFQ